MNLSSIICDLAPGQVHVFYEAVGYLISAQQENEMQKNLIERLMSFPNTIWDEIISHAAQVSGIYFCSKLCRIIWWLIFRMWIS